MTDQQWPPPSYYSTFNPKTELRERTERLHSIDAAIVTDDEGRRVMRFMTPQTPIKPGSVRVDGVLADRVAEPGVLYTFPPDPEIAGTIDYATGLIVIDLAVSPGTCSRRVEFEVAPPPPAC